MKISKLFHWLYCAVMFLPLFVLPVFALAVRSDNNYQPISIDFQKSLVVDFNQLYDGSNDQSFSDARYSASYDSDTHVFDVNVNNLSTVLSVTVLNTRLNSIVLGHKYLPRVIGDLDNLTTFDGVTSRGINTIISPTGSYLNLTLYIIPSNTPYHGNFIYNLFDLTQMFGAGNEPTSLQQFNALFPESYYDYTLSHKELIDDGVITYNDTDFGSQTIYTLYKEIDDYFNYDDVLSIGELYEWCNINLFNGNASLGFFIFFHLLEYWLLTSLLWLIFDILMYVPQLCHRWLDKASLE